MTKQELRKKYLEIRRSIENRSGRDELISREVLEEVKDFSLVLTYVSLDDEVDTIRIIRELIGSKKIGVPKVEDDVINFYLINSLEELKKGTFNVLEPITDERIFDFSNSVCIVPGICFNASGYRIGYGKGYYDRFLKDYNGDSIGLTYKECMIEDDFQDDHDIKVKKIICK